MKISSLVLTATLFTSQLTSSAQTLMNTAQKTADTLFIKSTPAEPNYTKDIKRLEAEIARLKESTKNVDRSLNPELRAHHIAFLTATIKRKERDLNIAYLNKGAQDAENELAALLNEVQSPERDSNIQKKRDRIDQLKTCLAQYKNDPDSFDENEIKELLFAMKRK